MRKERLLIKVCGTIFSSLVIFYLTYSNIKADLIHAYYFLTLFIQVYLTWEAFLLFLKYLDRKVDWEESLTRRLLIQIAGGTIIILLAFTLIQLIEYPFDKLLLKKHRLHGYWDFDIFICFLLALIIQLVYVIYYFIFHWKNPAPVEITQAAKKDFVSRIGNRQIVFSEDEVLCVYTENKMVFVLTHNRDKYILDMSLGEVVAQLDPAAFFRANRKYIIRKSAIKTIKSELNNRLSIETVCDPDIPIPITISRNNTPRFRKWFNL